MNTNAINGVVLYVSNLEFRGGFCCMKINKENIKKELKQLKFLNFIAIFIAGIINAIGVTLFLYPVKLYDAGISGTSMLLTQVCSTPFLGLPFFLIILNIPIFIFGIKKQGINFTIYSVFSVIIYSLVAFLITDVLPIDVSIASPLAESDLLLCAIFGGTLSGIGSGLVVRFGGAIDGIDVLSVTFAKKIGISIGTFNLIYNVILYIICGIVSGSWILPLYSIITYFVGSKVIDFVVDGFDSSKCAMIVTTCANEINEELSQRFSSSGTIVDAVGGYSKENKKIIYFITNRFQVNTIKVIVHKIDPNAFISLHEVSDIIKKNDNV